MEIEGDESFQIDLYELQGDAKLGIMKRAEVTITDDDGKL